MTHAGAPLPAEHREKELASPRSAMLAGPIIPSILRLALPTIVVLVAQTLVSVAETFYVSFLGTDAIVGVSVVFPVWMLMAMMSAGGLGAGVASAVARAIGGGRLEEANAIVFHAVILGVIMGSIFEVGIFLSGSTLFQVLGAHGQALKYAQSYAIWAFLGSIPIWIVNLCSAGLRGSGNVKIPALITLTGAALLIPLSPLFIFGFGPIPGLGVAGAGLAVTTYSCGACLVVLRYLGRGRSGLRLHLVPLRWQTFRDILRVGVIASIANVQLNLGVILVTGIVGHFGTRTLAGYGVASRLDYLLIPILFGLGSAVLTVVGTCVGAGDLERAKKVALAGTLIGGLFTETVGLTAALLPALWIGLFSHDSEVIAGGSSYLRAAAPFYGAMGVTFILGFVSQGSGRPLWTTLAGTVRLLVSAGLGWLAVNQWHASMPILSLIVGFGQVSSAIVCLGAFRSGVIWPETRDT